MSEVMQLDPIAAAVPKLDQYFGCWCVEPQRFLAMVDHVRGSDLRAHVEHYRAAVEANLPAVEARRGFDVVGNGVAMIHLVGTLQKFDSSFGGSSTIRARQAIRQAASDDAVKAILLRIDSPGGTVAGTKDLADDVAAAKGRKPVVAFIEDLGASAAFWVASQADQVFINSTALVGSIGTFAVVEDSSEAAGLAGVKVHVVRAGDFKGVGVPGTEVSDDHLADMQRIVNQLNSQFLAAVATGRRIPIADVRKLADGRVHVGREAVNLKLADGVQTLDQTIQQLSSKKGQRMSDQKQQTTEQQTNPSTAVAALPAAVPVAGAPQPATLAQLKAACPGATSDFLLTQIEGQATVEAASRIWAAQLAEQNQQLAADLKAAQAHKPGVQPVGSRAAAADVVEGAAQAQIEELVAGQMKAKGLSRQKALAKVCSDNPELRQAWVEQHNETAQRRGRGETAKL